MSHRILAALALVLSLAGCKRGSTAQENRIGLVSDVAGRGDQSFNDSALRGLELWGAGEKYAGGGYQTATPAELRASIPPELATRTPPIHPLPITPVVLRSNSQEDYQPNLQRLVDRGSRLAVATGSTLANAVGAVAKRNPRGQFLLIDSRLLDEQGKTYSLPNVRTVTFREEEGSYLAGALAGLVTRTGKVAFVGGREIPRVQKLEAGFRAGLAATNPGAAQQILVRDTGSVEHVNTGKQVAQDLIENGVDVVFDGAGSEGLGVIQVVKDARDAGQPVYAMGVDPDPWHLAPRAVLTSVVKHVDLAVYDAVEDLVNHRFSGSDRTLGLAEGGVALAPVRIDFPNKAEALRKLDALRDEIVAGRIHVPTVPEPHPAPQAKP